MSASKSFPLQLITTYIWRDNHMTKYRVCNKFTIVILTKGDINNGSEFGTEDVIC